MMMFGFEEGPWRNSEKGLGKILKRAFGNSEKGLGKF